MAYIPPDRDEDDRLLRWVELRHACKPMSDIARAYGVGKSTVQMATNRVRKDALAVEPAAAADFW